MSDAVPTTGLPAPPRRRRRKRINLLAWGMLAPAMASVALLLLWPMWLAVSLSFHQGQSMNVLRLSRLPLGLGNWRNALSDAVNWQALGHSAVYVVGSVVPTFAVGIILALLLNRAFPGRRILRSLMLLPWAVPGIVVAVAFAWLLDGSYGLVNALLRDLGVIRQNIAWFAEINTAMLAVILPTAWKALPFFTLTALAALQSIPAMLYEAAEIDGAGRLAQFRHVTWPAIRAPMTLALVLNGLWAFKEIDVIYATTGGGPAGATEVLAIRVWHAAFEDFHMGEAAALGLCMMAICVVLTLIAMPQINRRFF